jgi:hypothetical protein
MFVLCFSSLRISLSIMMPGNVQHTPPHPATVSAPPASTSSGNVNKMVPIPITFDSQDATPPVSNLPVSTLVASIDFDTISASENGDVCNNLVVHASTSGLCLDNVDDETG